MKIFSLTSLSEKTKKLIYSSRDPLVNNTCLEFEVNTHQISKFLLKKIVPIVGVNPYPLNELMLMTSVVCRVKPTHIFEWGTHYGKSARIFYETIKFFNLKSIIYTVDLPKDKSHKEHPGRKRALYIRSIPEINQFLGDGLNTSLKIYSKLIGSNVQVKPLFYL